MMKHTILTIAVVASVAALLCVLQFAVSVEAVPAILDGSSPSPGRRSLRASKASKKGARMLLKTKSSSKNKKKEPTNNKTPVTILSQQDFDSGTYRITKSGYYKLAEDIEFEPLPNNDYWPPCPFRDPDKKYPPQKYYLGFFAAITIEAGNVTIDLNGYTIRQSEKFYLLQRFFNVIELNDRIFVANTGVSSLNYQSSDKFNVTSSTAEPIGKIVKPSDIVIKNGRLGRSSHNGIHGNGIQRLKITNVHIEDFEVAGIHCNGCKGVEITKCTVGPSSNSVPVLATFSNARFLDHYAQRLIPHGFRREPQEFRQDLLKLTNSTTISFSDRPQMEPMTLSQVFARLNRALHLYREFTFNEEGNGDLSDDDIKLLEEAKNLFNNDFNLTDGSVQYGIFLNRLGTPKTDENFYGAGRETKDIKIKDVTIKGLHANPVEVAALQTEEGAFLQGPARDLIRIFDISSDAMRSLGSTFYKGNFLIDAYIAMWKLSSEFYKIRVFDSECGNFGSNMTFPMNLKLYPSYEEETCAQRGSNSDESLSGRDVTMLQKRYFGGLQMSQKFFDWATISQPKRFGLDTLLASPSSADVLRAGGRHRLVCDHDTMFHPMHGVVGLKVVEAEDVAIHNLIITDLLNTADLVKWECRHKWQIHPSGEDIIALKNAVQSPHQSSTVRGVELIRSNEVSFEKVEVHDLTSDEGSVIAFDIVGDENDRTDHDDDTGIGFKEVTVDALSGPVMAHGFRSSATPWAGVKGLTIGKPEEIDATLKVPRVILNYQVVNGFPPTPVDFQTVNPVDIMYQTTDLNTIEKVLAFRQEIISFFSSHYGMNFETNANEKYSIFEIIPVLDQHNNFTDSFISPLSLIDNAQFQFHASSLCVSDASGTINKCTEAIQAPAHDFSISFVAGPSGYMLHGAFGSDQGQYITQGNYIACGIYSFEGVKLDGVTNGSNLQVKYFGECPIDLRPIKTPGLQTMYINCALESNLFGKGVATGAIIYDFENYHMIYEGIPVPKVAVYEKMIFDDLVINPTNGFTTSSLQESLVPSFNHNDVRFAFVADGVYSSRLAGIEARPYAEIHHYTHEAVVEYFQQRTTFTTLQVKMLRRKFLILLKEKFMISAISDVDSFDDIPIDGVIDLGGGNRIEGYVVNEDSNQRVLTKQNAPGDPTVVMKHGSRLHEGGFRLVVGRAGLDTIDGRTPFGSTIMQGIFVLENGDTDGTNDVEIEFHSLGIVELNAWSTSVVYLSLHSDLYGEGRLIAAQPMPLVDENGINLKISGDMVFGNVF